MAEKDELLSHDYDGIQEYDNDLPKWWVAIFYICAIYGFGYAIYLHGGFGNDQYEQLALDMSAWEETRKAATAEQEKTAQEADFAALLENPTVVAKGGEIFQGKCAVCHGAAGQGVVGPNLTDEYWIYGREFERVKYIVVNGVTAKGMIPWKGVLTPEEIDAVTVYVRTLEGTNPENPKAPQGDKVEVAG